MKISELKFEQCIKPSESQFYMHYDNSDCLREICSQKDLDKSRNALMSKFGDVEVEIRLNGNWNERVVIIDAKWNAEHKDYCDAKQAWCNKYGCD